jgi:hypothetical protein
MTDDTSQTPEAFAPPEPATGAPEPGAAAGQSPAGEDPGAPAPEAKSDAREWLTQLQHMIDRVAEEAAPIARDVAAKAAELAAVAGEKAGPLARRAAEVTEDVGARVAVRSRQLADDIRHRGAESGVPPAAEPPGEDVPSAAPVDEGPPAD